MMEPATRPITNAMAYGMGADPHVFRPLTVLTNWFNKTRTVINWGQKMMFQLETAEQAFKTKVHHHNGRFLQAYQCSLRG